MCCSRIFLFYVSHRPSVTNNFVAVTTFVFLVVARGDTEGNQTAAEYATNETEHKAQNPCEGALHLIHMRETVVSTKLTSYSNGMVRPVGVRVGASMEFLFNNDILLLNLMHHRLTWDHHHLLTLVMNLLILNRLSRCRHHWL